ncbi:zinc ribbon-containing protein [Thiohalomonas denitrificans]|uniref:zinc ribbon-containing protein n=1 Tax=Thiohalomonas denitrificans TaxID=415747 RepID=UPI0026E97ADD|nr:zinc ribbon-containing protein [Thiohalomonas denitrificans]
MSEKENHGLGERLAEGYHRMLERVRHRLDEIEHDTGPTVKRAIDEAQERATELGELSREESRRVGEYLRKDLEDAATFLSESGRELGNWLKFDWNLIERSLADLFADAVDHTRVELEQFSERAAALGEWHTGEVTAMGTLQCKSCGEELHFHGPGHIPPCPKCHGTTFRRLTNAEQ